MGLRSDGTVVAVGANTAGRLNVSDWQDIVAVAAGRWHTAGLRADGTVVVTNENWRDYGASDVAGWRDIVAVAAGDWHTVGLRADGSVVDTWLGVSGDWNDIKIP